MFPELFTIKSLNFTLNTYGLLLAAVVLRAELFRGAAVVLVSHEVREAWPLLTHAHALILGEWAMTGPVGGSADQFLARYREALDG